MKSARVSRGSFYVYYKNKDDLLAEYLHSLEDEYLEFYETELCGPDYVEYDALEKISIFLKFVNQVLARNGKDLLRMYYSYLLGYTDVWATRDRHYFRVLDILISEARKEGLIRDDITDADIQLTVLYITRGITTEWSVCLTDYPIEKKDSLIDSFFRIIKRTES